MDNDRDVRNRFFYFGSVAVRFLFKKLGFGSELILFGSVRKNTTDIRIL